MSQTKNSVIILEVFDQVMLTMVNIRTKRSKKMGIAAAISMSLIYLLIFIRWRVGCAPLEVLYLFPYGFTLGVMFSTQFVGMISSVANERMGQCIGTYLLSQQLGGIMGPTFGLKFIDHIFRNSLENRIGPDPEKPAVRL